MERSRLSEAARAGACAATRRTRGIVGNRRQRPQSIGRASSQHDRNADADWVASLAAREISSSRTVSYSSVP